MDGHPTKVTRENKELYEKWCSEYSLILVYYLLQGIEFWVFWEDAGGGYFVLSIGNFLLYIQWLLIFVLLLWDFIFNKNQKQISVNSQNV